MKHMIHKIVFSGIILALIFVLWGVSIKPVAASAVAAVVSQTPSKTPVPNDIAFNKTVTGSTACASNEAAYRAVDGLWAAGSNSKWCSGVADKWLIIDLGTNYNVNSMTIYHAGTGGESTSYNTRDFQTFTSVNGIDYTLFTDTTGNTANQTIITGLNRTVRYIKLVVINGEQPGGENVARIYEVVVGGTSLLPTPTPSLINRALNKPATGSTPCNADEIPAYAADGSFLTKWCSADTTLSWQVDLGGFYPIRKIQIFHADYGESSEYNTRDFIIQRSSDNINWQTFAIVYGNTSAFTEHTSITYVTNMRYVRINIINGAQPGQANIARIYEIKVLGP